MKYTVLLGDRERVLEASALDETGVCRIAADEDVRRVTLAPVAAHQIRVTASPVDPTIAVDAEGAAPEHTRTLYLARASDGVWVWSRGRARLVSPAAERRTARRGDDRGKRGPVTPPMPAVVTELRVAEGQEVAEGQALVVVSAMKMEMTLAAPYAGTVTAIRTEPGAKVNPGDILVDVTPLDADQDGAAESRS